MDKINVFAINLVKRTDRRVSIVSEFADKEEFQLNIVPAIEHQIGAIGLWQTLSSIVQQSYNEGLEYVIICEDDHKFTFDYSTFCFKKAIADSIQFHADILLGGVSWFTTCVPVGTNLNWVEKFSGLQFTVIFKKFYTKILNSDFLHDDAADYKMSFLSNQIYFIYPFISIQKDFGYSDVTVKNNARNKVGDLFKNSSILVNGTKQVLSFYKKKIEEKVESLALSDFDNISFTTYVLYSESSAKILSQIYSQFEGREEFDIRMISLNKHTKTEESYWITLNKIVQQATDEDEDVIIVCEYDHLFTEAYSKENLMRHIIEGHHLDTKILCGGVDDFETAVPVTQDKVWIRTFMSSPFIVLYKSVFDKILKQPVCAYSTIESLYREITSNKMVIYPFISKREVQAGINSRGKCPSPKIVDSRFDRIFEITQLASETIDSWNESAIS